MNPPDDPLERLLAGAREGCPPIPEPSPWFEQQMLRSLKAQPIPSFGGLDGRFLLRILSGAAVLMALSVALPFLQTKNPYLETMELTNTTTQMERIP